MRASPARLLWLLACLLGAGVAAELALPAQISADVARPAPVVPPVRGPTQTEPIAAWATTSLERPLFTPGRRPEPRATAPDAAAASRPEPPRLAGIMLSSHNRQAIFAPGSAGDHGVVVGEGGRIAGWQVEAIRAGEVQLSGPNGRRTVRPAYSDVRSSATPAAPPPQPAFAGALLPPPPRTDTTPLNATSQPSGAAIFLNMQAAPAARTPR